MSAKQRKARKTTSSKLIAMVTRKAVWLLLAVGVSASAQTIGWKVIRDQTNACQVSIPPTWKPSDSYPGSADAPGDQGTVILKSRPGQFLKPFSEAVQKGMMGLTLDKMIENTPQMVFYSYDPHQKDQAIDYNARVPAKGGSCTVHLSVKKGVTEDMVKKIAGTLKPTS